MKKEKKSYGLPDSKTVEKELNRVKHKDRYVSTIRGTIYSLITVAAVAVLVAVLFLPVLQIYGKSMEPTLSDEQVVVSIKGSDFKTGDVLAFYYNNKVLVKRVIATPGQWVDIDVSGNVYVDNEKLEEPYIREKAKGECNIDLPYQVPEGKLFVLGDHRSVSIDSRNTAIGCVSEEQIVGKIVFRIG